MKGYRTLVHRNNRPQEPRTILEVAFKKLGAGGELLFFLIRRQKTGYPAGGLFAEVEVVGEYHLDGVVREASFFFNLVHCNPPILLYKSRNDGNGLRGAGTLGRVFVAMVLGVLPRFDGSNNLVDVLAGHGPGPKGLVNLLVNFGRISIAHGESRGKFPDR